MFIVLSKQKTNHGFALIEAMLALFILTIGILGVAGMQTQAIQSGSVASQRMIVTIKTQELIERMMANPGLTVVTRTQVAGSNNAVVTTATTNDVSNYVVAGAGKDNACATAKACTPLETAEYDIFLWRTALDELLPQDTASNPPYPRYAVNVNAGTRIVTLGVTWLDRGNEYSYAVATQVQPLIVERSGI